MCLDRIWSYSRVYCDSVLQNQSVPKVFICVTRDWIPSHIRRILRCLFYSSVVTENENNEINYRLKLFDQYKIFEVDFARSRSTHKEKILVIHEGDGWWVSIGTSEHYGGIPRWRWLSHLNKKKLNNFLRLFCNLQNAGALPFWHYDRFNWKYYTYYIASNNVKIWTFAVVCRNFDCRKDCGSQHSSHLSSPDGHRGT